MRLRGGSGDGSSGTADPWRWQVLPLQGTTTAVLIVDPQGRTVWYRVIEEEGNLLRAMLSHDRHWMIHLLAGGQAALSAGKVRWVRLDGSE